MTTEDGLKLLQYNVTKYTNLLYRIVTSVYKMTACISAKIARKLKMFLLFVTTKSGFRVSHESLMFSATVPLA